MEPDDEIKVVAAELRDEFNLDPAEIARRLGLAEFRVTWRLSLLNLSPPIARMVDRGQVAPQLALEAARLPSHRQQTQLVQLVKEAGGACAICGFSSHPRALEFHHVDPATKKFHLSYQGLTRGIREMRAEAAKCVLLCANCHALVEAGVKKVPGADR